jgi:hypothetical protein
MRGDDDRLGCTPEAGDTGLAALADSVGRMNGIDPMDVWRRRGRLKPEELAELERREKLVGRFVWDEERRLFGQLAWQIVVAVVVIAAAIGVMSLAGWEPTPISGVTFAIGFVSLVIIGGVHSSRMERAGGRARTKHQAYISEYLREINYHDRFPKLAGPQTGAEGASDGAPHWYVDGWQTGYHRRGDFSRADRRAMNEGGMDVDTYRNNVQERDN